MPASKETVKAVRLLMAIEKRWERGLEEIGNIIEELTSDLNEKETLALFEMLVKEGGE